MFVLVYDRRLARGYARSVVGPFNSVEEAYAAAKLDSAVGSMGYQIAKVEAPVPA